MGQSRGPIQPVGYAVLSSYIIVKAAKSSSKRRNCQNKGCQCNFNSASWRICLLMWSLITSSQPTFPSARLLLHSGHSGQTAINEGPVNILFCPFLFSVWPQALFAARHQVPALRQNYSSSPGLLSHVHQCSNCEVPPQEGISFPILL